MKITKEDIIALHKQGMPLHAAQRLLDIQTMEIAINQIDGMVDASNTDPNIKTAIKGINVILRRLIQYDKERFET